MKKAVMFGIVLVLALSLPAWAFAATFPPSTVAFELKEKPDVFIVLTLKANGSAKMSNQVKFYNVAGVAFDKNNAMVQFPVSGSAYVNTDFGGNQTLYFSLSGSLDVFFDNHWFVSLQGWINSSLNDGQVHIRQSESQWAAPQKFQIRPLTPTELKALSIPKAT
jgi:hypothetical protein